MPVRLSLLWPLVACLALPYVTAGAQAGASMQSSPGTGREPASSALGDRISSILSDPAVARAHWGIAVTTLEGTPLFSLEDAKLFRPASTAKLFTTAAAMTLLGPTHRFTTRVFGDLDPATGTVQGDLTLVGGGDPSFGTDDLPYRPPPTYHEPPQRPFKPNVDETALALSRAGVKQVTGDIVGDDRLFERATVPEGWAEEDLLWGYGTLPSALSFADNEVRLTITPESAPAAGSDEAAPHITRLDSNQPFSFLHVDNKVITTPHDAAHTDGVDAHEIPASTGDPQSVRLFGSLASGAAPVHETLAVRDAAAYAAGALQAALEAHGIALNGQAKAVHSAPPSEAVPFLHTIKTPGCEASLWGEAPPCAPPCPDPSSSSHLLAEHTSPPLAEDVTFTLKTSANLHAELLLRHLGRLVTCSGVPAWQGARVLHSWLLHIGLVDGDVTLYDGSGLSTKDLATPRAEAQVLAYAARQPWFAQWKAALPIGGVDGTLSGRFTEEPLKGHVYAKTGTLGETRALAGYVRCASGKDVIVVVLVDNHEPGNAADRTAMDKIVAAIAELN